MTGTSVETPYLNHQLTLARQTGAAESRTHLRRALGEAMWLLKYHAARGESELAMNAYQWVDTIMASMEQQTPVEEPRGPDRPNRAGWLRHWFKWLRRMLLPTPRRRRSQPMTS